MNIFDPGGVIRGSDGGSILLVPKKEPICLPICLDPTVFEAEEAIMMGKLMSLHY